MFKKDKITMAQSNIVISTNSRDNKKIIDATKKVFKL